jgi:hypothetical protein
MKRNYKEGEYRYLDDLFSHKPSISIIKIINANNLNNEYDIKYTLYCSVDGPFNDLSRQYAVSSDYAILANSKNLEQNQEIIIKHLFNKNWKYTWSIK